MLYRIDCKNYLYLQSIVYQTITIICEIKKAHNTLIMSISVGMTGFEPAASSSRTKRATGLRYIPSFELARQS